MSNLTDPAILFFLFDAPAGALLHGRPDSTGHEADGGPPLQRSPPDLNRPAGLAVMLVELIRA